MSWKFWQKPQLVEPPRIARSLAAIIGTEWPDSIAASAELLLTLFEGNAPPFRHWRAQGITFQLKTTPIYETFVRNYQCWLFFQELAARTDCWSAEFCRDAVCALAKPRLNHLKSYLEFIQSAADFAQELPADRRSQLVAGEWVTMPHEYLMSLYALLTLNESPYFNQQEPAFRGDDIALARCLVQAKLEAATVFAPMTAAIKVLDLDRFEDWSWRDNPGPRERHLIRRRGNPLFEPSRREVQGTEVVMARRADDAELVALSQNLQDLEEQVREKVPRLRQADFLAKCLETADGLNDRALHYGPAGEKIRARILTARAAITEAWRESVTDNPQGLEVLETTEKMAAERRHWLSGQTPLVNDLMHEAKPIPAEEIVPAVLSEPVQDFDQLVDFLGLNKNGVDSAEHLRRAAAELVRSRMDEGVVLPGMQEKLAMMGVRLQ